MNYWFTLYNGGGLDEVLECYIQAPDKTDLSSIIVKTGGGNVHRNDHDELYCDNILGACAFSRFFAHGGECSEILSKNIMCLFCNEKMITVKDGLFKSHRECSKCGKGIPNYDELAKWICKK